MAKQATKEESQKPEVSAKYVVVQEFRDKANFSIVHEAGSDVSHFDPVRLEDLLQKGLIEKQL